MTDPEFAATIRQKIHDRHTHGYEYYGGKASPKMTDGTSQISVIAGNGDAVSCTTTINYALVVAAQSTIYYQNATNC